MKKRVLAVVFACALLAGIVMIATAFCGKRPYKDLDASQIAAATVYLTPPDKTVEIENLQELAEYLNDITIYRKDNSYTEYVGQAAVFTLTMTDGTQKEIMGYNPFLVIDGIGYRTEYEPCEALNSYANELLKAQNEDSGG